MTKTKNSDGLRILSLFDGISVGQLSIRELGLPIDTYYASEIDKNAIKVTQHHFPGTIQLGDVRGIDDKTIESLGDIDLMIFGSPCTDLSSINKNSRQLGLDGEKSSLFYEALRILKKVQPHYWLMENVASMPSWDRDKISKELGCEPILINSELVGGAKRARYYWTNIPNITQPLDRGITLQSILEYGYADKLKANAVLTRNVPHTVNGLRRYLTKSIGNVKFLSPSFAYLPKEVKLQRLERYNDETIKKVFEPLSPLELERLQTLPDGYVSEHLKKTPSSHAVGNSFTSEVIKNILKNMEL